MRVRVGRRWFFPRSLLLAAGLRPRPALALLAFLAAPAGVLPALAAETAPTPPASSPPASTPSAAPPAPEAAEEEVVEWKRDPSGREYRVEAIERSRVHERMDDGRLLTRWGILLDYEGEDDRFYYYRVYRPPEGAGGPRRRMPERAAPSTPPKPPEDATPGGAPSAAGSGGIASASSAAAWEALPTARTIDLQLLADGLPEPAQWRNGLRLADLDGDGRLDLVLPPGRKRLGGPLLLLRRGDGWRRWGEARLPAVRWDYGDVEVADFDGDGRADLAFAMHLQGLLVAVQRESGRFEAWSEGIALGRPDGGPIPFSSRALRSGDGDGDGRLDLLVLGEGPRLAAGRMEEGAFGLRLFRNLGEGRWEAQGPLPGSEALFGQALAAGEVGGDGRRGFLAASDAGDLGGLLVRAADGTSTAAELPLPAGFRVVAGGMGDLDGDGAAELAVAATGRAAAGWTSTVEVLMADGRGGWRRETVLLHEGDAYRFTALALADLDGDGRAELAVGTGDGRLLLLRRSPDGWRREEAEPLAAHAGCRVYHVAAGADGDGSRLLAVNRAGEATGTPLLGAAKPGCPGGGDVHVWRVAEPEPAPVPSGRAR